eukprot:scaffold296511_cov26-Prasinocladus_malaysianus.AAC.1
MPSSLSSYESDGDLLVLQDHWRRARTAMHAIRFAGRRGRKDRTAPLDLEEVRANGDIMLGILLAIVRWQHVIKGCGCICASLFTHTVTKQQARMNET